MAMRKPPQDTKRTREIVRMLDGKSKEPLAADKPLPKAARPERWDGADQEAHDILEIADYWKSKLSIDERRKLIAARLRKIAQGPRKWGVLR